MINAIQIFAVIAAAVDPGRPGSVEMTPLHRKLLTGAMPVLLAGMVLLFGLIIWAVFVRTQKKERHQRGRLIDGPVQPRSVGNSGRRRRRRREKRRPVNPTLSETGGLPPLREDGEAGPEPKP